MTAKKTVVCLKNQHGQIPIAVLGYNLGLALEKRGDLENAIVQYTKAIEINTAHPDAYLNLANAYLELGMKSEALAAYRNGLKTNPDDARVRHNLSILLENRGNR